MKIDRSKWEPCGICEVPTHWKEWYNKGYWFCPHCGYPLNEQAWKELERKVFGE